MAEGKRRSDLWYHSLDKTWRRSYTGKVILVSRRGRNPYIQLRISGFTVKDNVIYAISLDWPGDEITIKFLAGVGLLPGEEFRLYESEIESIKMLGVDEELEWTMTEDGLTIKTPDKKSLASMLFTFKIETQVPRYRSVPDFPWKIRMA